MKISYLYRKKEDQFNSIEEIFETTENEVSPSNIVEHIEVPNSGARWKDIIKNLNFCKSINSDIVHITGHINYVSLKLKTPTVLTIHDTRSSFNKNLRYQLLCSFFRIYYRNNYFSMCKL